jgi:hypothetical protein
MATQYGRTVPDYEKLLLGAAGGSMIDMKIASRGELGLDYEAQDRSSLSDGGKGVLTGKPNFVLDFSGPIDNTLSTGPSVLLKTWAANKTLLSMDYQQGIQHAWEAGEPQLGVTGVVASNSGMIVSKYKESGSNYNAQIMVRAGSAVYPDWGTAAETVPA